MQDTPERGKRIGVCKQCLKKKIAEQIQRLLTQVFTGGIIFPGLLSPKLLCAAPRTCSDFPIRGRDEGEVASPDRSRTTQEVSDQLWAGLVCSFSGRTFFFFFCFPPTCWNRVQPVHHFLLSQRSCSAGPRAVAVRGPFPGVGASHSLGTTI